ncbi:MAG: dihydrofolate reductase, partial [Planctomycetota bacterium]
MQPLDLIAALARGRVIGSGGALPWHHPADLAHFRRATMGRVLVMGRVTWESLGGALDGRSVVMLSRRRPAGDDDLQVANDPATAL